MAGESSFGGDFWAAILPTLIEGGVSIAKGSLADDNSAQSQAQAKELKIMDLQDNERTRANDVLLRQLANEASLKAASIAAASDAAITKKKILGDALLQQGKGEGEILLERFKARASRPERFNDAASVLAQILSGR